MINIDFRDRRPICEQLVDNIGKLAARGLLPAGSQLPSVRQLAMELSINPNTIQKAYAELERGGVIVSIKGRGSFISEDTQKLRDSRIGLIRQELAGLVEQSVAVGFAEKDFLTEAQRQFACRKEKSDD